MRGCPEPADGANEGNSAFPARAGMDRTAPHRGCMCIQSRSRGVPRACGEGPGLVRLDRRRVELRPESANPEHKAIEVDLKRDAFEICGIAVGALIGDGFNGPEHEDWTA